MLAIRYSFIKTLFTQMYAYYISFKNHITILIIYNQMKV